MFLAVHVDLTPCKGGESAFYVDAIRATRATVITPLRRSNAIRQAFAGRECNETAHPGDRPDRPSQGVLIVSISTRVMEDGAAKLRSAEAPAPVPVGSERRSRTRLHRRET